MQSLSSYLTAYSESHQNQKNIRIHNVCVPAIMWSLLGVLHTWSLSYVLVAAALIYYSFFKNVKVLAAMALVSVTMLLSFNFVPALPQVSIFVFVVAWIGQFYGHKIEGKKPSFLKDLQFLLIGPVWVLFKLFPLLFKGS